MQYLPLLLNDPTVVDDLAFAAFHGYYAAQDTAQVIDYVRSRQPDLPVIVTEYTSFGFGDLDSGQEADDGVGFMLDVTNTLLSHSGRTPTRRSTGMRSTTCSPGTMRLPAGGILRGPQRDFARRRRYYGFLQALPYLRPGTRVLDTQLHGDAPDLGYLAVRTPSGAPAIFLVNQSVDEVDLTLGLTGAGVPTFPSLAVWRTDREHSAEPFGRVQLQGGSGSLALPPRSLTTLFPAGAEVDPVDN